MNKKIAQNQKVDRRDFLKVLSLVVLSLSFGSLAGVLPSLKSSQNTQSGYGNSRYGY